MTISQIKQLDRYKDFTWLESHQLFSRFFRNKNYDLVQIHDATSCGDDDIVGFCGVFSWKDNELMPLDGDSYTSEMLVIGYSEFEINDEECPNLRTGLDILMEE